MNKVKKGVIIVAGMGTRFLPATKAMPKEMLPVLDKPVVQYIVEEMVESGISEIMFVTSAQKRPIEDHFDRDSHIEQHLKAQGKLERLLPLIHLIERVRFFYTRQPAPLGNGHALLCAKEFLGDSAFAFSDGDSIIDSKIPVIKQLLRVFEKKQGPVIGVQRLEDPKEMTKYGNIYAKPTQEPRIYRVSEIKEKPPEEDVSPHGLIAGGMRYILNRDIWQFLERQPAGKGGEIWLADAANALARKKTLYAYEYDGQYFDTGTPLSLLKTAIHFAMKEEGVRKELQGIL